MFVVVGVITAEKIATKLKEGHAEVHLYLNMGVYGSHECWARE